MEKKEKEEQKTKEGDIDANKVGDAARQPVVAPAGSSNEGAKLAEQPVALTLKAGLPGISSKSKMIPNRNTTMQDVAPSAPELARKGQA